jgi:hypothetical protein
MSVTPSSIGSLPPIAPLAKLIFTYGNAIFVYSFGCFTIAVLLPCRSIVSRLDFLLNLFEHDGETVESHRVFF